MTPTQLRAAIEQLEREGWKVVPKEPTPKMVDSTYREAIGMIESHNSRNHRIYNAMLSAAPAYSGGE